MFAMPVSGPRLVGGLSGFAGCDLGPAFVLNWNGTTLSASDGRLTILSVAEANVCLSELRERVRLGDIARGGEVNVRICATDFKGTRSTLLQAL